MPKGTPGRGQCTVVIDGVTCERRHAAKGLCATHYSQKQDGRPLRVPRKRAPKVVADCVAPNCTLRAHARGMCGGHYQQWKAGKPLGPFRTDGYRFDGTMKCVLPECDRSVLANEMCGAHYRRGKRYNFTVSGYLEFLASHPVCDICGSDEDLHIDHDHDCCNTPASHHPTCGRCTRGHLCGHCNRALGALRDDTERLRSAIAYLERWQRRVETRSEMRPA